MTKGYRDIGSVYCFFERSGAFKKAFRSIGIPAIDLDCINDFGETDVMVDLFGQIEKASEGKESIFDTIQENDIIIAFFPCTYFTDQSAINSRGNNPGMKNWSISDRLDYSKRLMRAREEYYSYLSLLCKFCIEHKIMLVIENPFGKYNFLRQYFPLRPDIVLLDRTEWGDRYRKPTQFFFINCTPELYLIPPRDMRKAKDFQIQNVHGFERSVMSQKFAETFIKNVFFGKKVFFEEEDKKAKYARR